MTKLPTSFVDAHTHFFYDRQYYRALFEERHMRVVVINITGEGLFNDTMNARWEAMVALKERYPERIMLCTTFDPKGVTQEGFAEKAIQKLQEDLSQGASIVKVWKDIGLGVRDDDGSWVQITDARFAPIWAFLAEEEVPVIAHIAEPRAAWQPLDRRSPHYRYYHAHPQHHLYRRDDVLSWQELIDARDDWIEENPKLTIIGAHFGSMAHDVREVACRLDRYPNFYVDTAERFGDLAIQPTERVRRFFERYADRIIYGTDFLLAEYEPPGVSERDMYEALLADHWNFLAEAGSLRVHDKFMEPTRTTALELPFSILRKLYNTNACKLLALERDSSAPQTQSGSA